MAKKKVDMKEKEEVEDLDDDLFDDEEIKSHYPDMGKSKPDSQKKTTSDFNEDIQALDEEEFLDEDFTIMEAEPEITYKYLNLIINRGVTENDYNLKVEGQSHGLLNIFVKHLLNIEGVNTAAYKVTQIDPPELFIRLEKGFEIKDILHKGINSLRNEISEVQKAFKKLS